MVFPLNWDEFLGYQNFNHGISVLNQDLKEGFFIKKVNFVLDQD